MDSINIIVNGDSINTKKDITLKQLIDDLKVEDKIMASAINTNVVKKDMWDKTIIKKGDKIEFLAFVGGG